MKYLVFLFTVVLFLSACLKNNTEPQDKRLYNYLSFIYVQGPVTVNTTDTINFQIRVAGSTGCERLEGYEGNYSADKQYDLRAVGSYPNPIYGDTLSCTNPAYVKDTIIRFTPRGGTGKHIFRWYNGSNLFRADTVQVN